MYIAIPEKYDVVLNDAEKKTIVECMNILRELTNMMEEYSCSTLMDRCGDTLSVDDIETTFDSLETIWGATKLYVD